VLVLEVVEVVELSVLLVVLGLTVLVIAGLSFMIEWVADVEDACAKAWSVFFCVNASKVSDAATQMMRYKELVVMAVILKVNTGFNDFKACASTGCSHNGDHRK